MSSMFLCEERTGHVQTYGYAIYVTHRGTHCRCMIIYTGVYVHSYNHAETVAISTYFIVH